MKGKKIVLLQDYRKRETFLKYAKQNVNKKIIYVGIAFTHNVNAEIF